jgi:hypothetical protein
LNASHDKITDSKSMRRATDSKSMRRAQFVGTIAVKGTTFLGQQWKDLFGELSGRTGKM